MKIATFNINNINKRLPNLLAWIKRAKPDVVCLQELKSESRSFPAESLNEMGYHAVWQGQRTWNGVAILSKRAPIPIRHALPGDKSDNHARYIEAAVEGTVIGCIYLPNGNPYPGPKFDYKLAWFDRLIKHAKMLDKENVPVVLAGDFNVVPDLKIDIYPTRSWDDDALTQPQSRMRFRKLIDAGWLDSIRALYPDDRIYSYWDYQRQRWERNGGLRLDHILLNDKLQKCLDAGGVDKWTRGVEGASDHAPVWIELRSRKKAHRRKIRGGLS
jgi:exodeoxyribonuclease-3